MLIPEEFKRFTRRFLQGSDREARDEREWVRNAIAMTPQSDRVLIKKFLVELLNTKVGSKELITIWESGSPSFGVYENHIRKFFEDLRDTIVS